MADPYVYFYELGVRPLKPGGVLCLVVANKWMKAGYGEPVHRSFSENAWVRSVWISESAKKACPRVTELYNGKM